MAKILDFYVQFNERWSVYAPGDVVTGVVHLDFGNEIFCDQVVAQFYGSARTFWVERQTKPPVGLVNQAFSSEQVFFDEKSVLWGAEEVVPRGQPRSLDDILRSSSALKLDNMRRASERAERSHLDAGHHKFRFEFRLPDGLPTSFDAAHADGFVRYFVKVMICEWGVSKHSRKGYFTVVRPVDLNEMRVAREQVARHVTRPLRSRPSLGCLGGRRDGGGGVSALLTLQQSGVVPGERVKMTVEVDNASARAAVIKVRLVQTVVCYTAEPEYRRRRSTKTVAAVASDKVEPHGATVWRPPLFVPAVVPSFALDELIECSYALAADVCVRANEPALLTVGAPVVVGTVPLRPPDAAAPHKRASPSPPPYTPMSDMPPPTYEQSQLGISGDAADVAFAPRYAVYEFAQSVAAERTLPLLQ